MPDAELFPDFDEFAARYFPDDRPMTDWQRRLAARVLDALHRADQEATTDDTEAALPGFDWATAVLLGPGVRRPPVGRSSVLAALVSMLRDSDRGVRLLFSSRSEAREHVKAAQSELMARLSAEREAMVEGRRQVAADLLGVRAPGVALTPNGWREVGSVPQPVLSAGDVERVMAWGRTIDAAKGLDDSERALLLQLERWAHPDVWVIPPPRVEQHPHPWEGVVTRGLAAGSRVVDVQELDFEGPHPPGLSRGDLVAFGSAGGVECRNVVGVEPLLRGVRLRLETPLQHSLVHLASVRRVPHGYSSP